MIIRKRTGQQAFNAIFDQTGAWASVPTSENWRKPFMFMGPIEYGKKRREVELVSIAVTVEHETEKAWLLIRNGKQFWFPKSWGDLDESELWSGRATLTADIYKLREKGVAPHDEHDRLPEGSPRQHQRVGVHLLVHQ